MGIKPVNIVVGPLSEEEKLDTRLLVARLNKEIAKQRAEEEESDQERFERELVRRIEEARKMRGFRRRKIDKDKERDEFIKFELLKLQSKEEEGKAAMAKRKAVVLDDEEQQQQQQQKEREKRRRVRMEIFRNAERVRKAKAVVLDDAEKEKQQQEWEKRRRARYIDQVTRHALRTRKDEFFRTKNWFLNFSKLSIDDK